MAPVPSELVTEITEINGSQNHARIENVSFWLFECTLTHDNQPLFAVWVKNNNKSVVEG